MQIRCSQPLNLEHAALKRERVEQALSLKSQAAIDAMFADVPHFEYRQLVMRPWLENKIASER